MKAQAVRQAGAGALTGLLGAAFAFPGMFASVTAYHLLVERPGVAAVAPLFGAFYAAVLAAPLGLVAGCLTGLAGLRATGAVRGALFGLLTLAATGGALLARYEQGNEEFAARHLGFYPLFCLVSPALGGAVAGAIVGAAASTLTSPADRQR